MFRRSVIVSLNLLYLLALVLFLILFNFQIKIKFLTNLIIITSIVLMFLQLLYWYIKYNKILQIQKKSILNEKSLLLRLLCCILVYITPVFYIVQQPYLIVNHEISVITFIIIIVLALIGIFFERKIFIYDLKMKDNNAI